VHPAVVEFDGEYGSKII